MGRRGTSTPLPARMSAVLMPMIYSRSYGGAGRVPGEEAASFPGLFLAGREREGEEGGGGGAARGGRSLTCLVRQVCKAGKGFAGVLITSLVVPGNVSAAPRSPPLIR